MVTTRSMVRFSHSDTMWTMVPSCSSSSYVSRVSPNGGTIGQMSTYLFSEL